MRWKEQTIALLIFIVRLFYLEIHFVKRWSSCGFRNKIKSLDEISGLRCSHSVFPADLPTRHCLSRANTVLIAWNWAIVLYTWESRDRMECSINRMSLLGGHQPTKKSRSIFLSKLLNCPRCRVTTVIQREAASGRFMSGCGMRWQGVKTVLTITWFSNCNACSVHDHVNVQMGNKFSQLYSVTKI